MWVVLGILEALLGARQTVGMPGGPKPRPHWAPFFGSQGLGFSVRGF